MNTIILGSRVSTDKSNVVKVGVYKKGKGWEREIELHPILAEQLSKKIRGSMKQSHLEIVKSIKALPWWRRLFNKF
jgi:hypothetical protein